LRVALVHDWLTGMRGGEKVLEAIGALFPEAPIFTLFHFPGSVSAAIESHPIQTSFLQRAPGIRRHYRRYLPLFPAAIEDFDLSGFDLVISSSHCVAKGIIPPPDGLHCCYCHTPMRYAWDQEHAYFPRRRGLGARLRALTLTALRAWDAAAAARVDLFVANSSFVARRIGAFYGREAEVVHPPVAVDFFTPAAAAAGDGGAVGARGAHGADGPDGPDAATGASGMSTAGYALVVSALAPYKRIEVAIAACQRAGIELRIAGDGPERGRLERLARTVRMAGEAGQGGQAGQAGRAASGHGSGAPPRVELLGRVGDAALRDLYRGARMLLQPGVEDFGIAAVEALACGTPVVAAARGGVLDVVEDGRHGVLYDDREGAAALAGAIDKALRIGFNALDLRNRAESFAAGHFADRMRSLVACHQTRALASRRVSRVPPR
jgi:glycosyltransferase involved in cell wall biosynthesis